MTTQESALHVAQHVRYVGVMMSEPRDDDDVALDIDDAIPEDEFDTLEEKYGLK